MIMSDRLKAARKACKFTQQQVADLLGVDRSTYAYYELGTSRPSFENLVRLSSIFNTDTGWLLGEDIDIVSWSAPESDFDIIAQIKERKIAELTDDEKFIVGLYRIAEKSGKKGSLLEILNNAIGVSEDE